MSSSRSGREHRCVIDTWQVTYLVPQGSAFSSADRDRLDGMLRSEAAERIARSLDVSVEASDPSVWRIRSMEADLGSTLAPQALAGRIAASILGELTQDADPGRVLRFPSRAAYLARFVVDLVHGRAWDRWYFEEFASLRPLSTSRAICESLLQQEGDIAPVLLCLLADHGLSSVLGALSAIDAEHLFHAWLPAQQGASSSGLARWVPRLLHCWSQTPCRWAAGNPWRDGLWWLSIAATHHPGAEADEDLVGSVSTLLEIRTLFQSIDSLYVRGQVVQLLADNHLEAALRLATTPSTPSPLHALTLFAALMEQDLDWGLNAVSILIGDQQSSIAVTTSLQPYGEPVESPFSGVFRLGPSFLATQTVPILLAAGLPSLLPLFVHLIATQCMGAPHASSSMRSVALCTFSGINAASLDEAFEQLRFVEPLHLNALQRALVASLDAQDEPASPAWLIAQTGSPASSALLLMDSDTGEWLDAELLSSDDSARAAMQALRLRHLPLSLPPITTASQLPGRDPSVDLAWFSILGADSRLDPLLSPRIHHCLHLFLALLARRILRHFARGLMGFHLSSPQYIVHNFLLGSGSIRHCVSSISVELDPPPLAVVLRLAGAHQQSYSPTWLPADPQEPAHRGTDICIQPRPE